MCIRDRVYHLKRSQQNNGGDTSSPRTGDKNTPNGEEGGMTSSNPYLRLENDPLLANDDKDECEQLKIILEDNEESYLSSSGSDLDDELIPHSNTESEPSQKESN
eukprot:TRINITY_DN18774_c0_g1_i1.p1 TRINITY_DN18774_c0_g1~~TRINITY_DN18774_c0_g1_i1.p1  ORF type:complete len:116 (-),score=26.73 TRINITY_DN18774_c0_g1_i1:101-415(-)